MCVCMWVHNSLTPGCRGNNILYMAPNNTKLLVAACHTSGVLDFQAAPRILKNCYIPYIY